MCGALLVGLLFGALTLKAMRRWAYFHNGGCGPGAYGFGSGCGPHGGHSGHFGHRGRRFMYYRWGGPGGYGEGRWGGYGTDDNPFGVRSGARYPSATKPIPEILRSLELNERQQQEATPVLALAQEWLGPAGPRIEAALLAIAADRFEPVLVEGLLVGAPEGVQRELTEGLEHLHTILIAEQREQLRNQLSRKKAAPAAGPASGIDTNS